MLGKKCPTTDQEKADLVKCPITEVEAPEEEMEEPPKKKRKRKTKTGTGRTNRRLPPRQIRVMVLGPVHHQPLLRNQPRQLFQHPPLPKSHRSNQKPLRKRRRKRKARIMMPLRNSCRCNGRHWPRSGHWRNIGKSSVPMTS